MDGAIGTATAGRVLWSREGLGVAAHVVQDATLSFERTMGEQPTLILVVQGRKELAWDRGRCVVQAGDAVAIGGGRRFEVTNHPSGEGAYEALWMALDPELVTAHDPGGVDGSPIRGLHPISEVETPFRETFLRAMAVFRDGQSLPQEIAKHRLAEVLAWIAHRGGRFVRTPPSLAVRLRQLLSDDPSRRWLVPDVARRFAMSEATLRRHLARERASLSGVLAEVRMTHALTLLQCTENPVSQVALEVGYDSPSRFALRFRRRFGFSPGEVRHQSRIRSDKRRAAAPGPERCAANALGRKR